MSATVRKKRQARKKRKFQEGRRRIRLRLENVCEAERPQGQRPLKCFSGNNFQKEVLGPPTTSTLHGDAVAARVLLQE